MNHQKKILCYVVHINVIDTMKIIFNNFIFASRTLNWFTYISSIFYGTRNVFAHFSIKKFMGFKKCPPFLSYIFRKMRNRKNTSGACFVGHPVEKIKFWHIVLSNLLHIIFLLSNILWSKQSIYNALVCLWLCDSVTLSVCLIFSASDWLRRQFLAVVLASQWEVACISTTWSLLR